MTANRDSSPEGGNDCGTESELVPGSETVTLSGWAETFSSLTIENIEEGERRGVPAEELERVLRNHADHLAEEGYEAYAHPIDPEVVRGER